MKDKVINAIFINAFIVGIVILISYLTGTATDTYGPGWGISGWVIGDNRCCNSDIVSSLSVFLTYFAITRKKPLFIVLIPVGVFLLLITNGTHACYITLYGVMLLYPLYIIIRALITKVKLSSRQIVSCAVLLSLFILAIVVYPYTPRYKMEMYERSFFSDVQIVFEQKLRDKGYEVSTMTPKERMETPEVHDAMVEYYLPFLYSGMPDRTVEMFDIDRIIWKYGATIDATKIGDNRDMKQVFAGLMFEDCDFLTRCFGYEFATIGEDLTADLENDWYAILYYYGYIGFAAFILLMVFILYRVIKLLVKEFKTNLTDENACLLICFCLMLGLAYFSGAILRRPNASIYTSLVTALVYFKTKNISGDKIET